MDYNYNKYQVLPSSVNTLLRFGASKRWTFTFNLFTPASYEIESSAEVNDGKATLFRSINDKLLMVGVGLSYRINRRLAFGAVLYGIYHTFKQYYDLTDIVPLEGGGADVLQFTQSEDAINFGYTASFGVKWEPVNRFLIGLSIRLPSGMLGSKGSSFTRFVSAIPSANLISDAQTSNDDTQTKRQLPLRINLGLGYQVTRRFAISADVSFYAPQTYNAVYSAKNPDLLREVRQNLVVNAALGVEVYARQKWPIRLGAFTDFSAAPEPVVGVYEADKIDLFGGTFSFGRVGEENETTFGVTAAAGPTKVVGFDFDKGTYEAFVSDGHQWRVFLVYSGAFSI